MDIFFQIRQTVWDKIRDNFNAQSKEEAKVINECDSALNEKLGMTGITAITLDQQPSKRQSQVLDGKPLCGSIIAIDYAKDSHYEACVTAENAARFAARNNIGFTGAMKIASAMMKPHRS